MAQYNYTYLSLETVFESIDTLADFGVGDFIILGILLCGLVLFVYIVLPIVLTLHDYNKKQSSKRKRKKLLTQISTQKEIEEEIEQEIQRKEQIAHSKST